MLLHWPTKTPHGVWAAPQRERFRRDGYVVVERVFARAECRRFVRHMGGLRAGQASLGEFGQPEHSSGHPFNQHLCGPLALQFLVDERLHRPLADCFEDEPEAIRTVLVTEGSERLLYQDQYDLPDCMSAWIAMVDINEDNGPLVVQPGSHKGRLVTRSDPDLDRQPGANRRYFELVREAYRENGRDVVRVLVDQGDVVLFHGRLIHGGAPVRRRGTPRYALACHYIPYHSAHWDRDWPRTSCDTRRMHCRSGAARN